METAHPSITPPIAPNQKKVWPYLLTIIITAAISAGITYWLTKSTDKPATTNDAVSVPSSVTTPPTPTDITATQAETAVQKIITDKSIHVRYDHMSTDNTKYIVQAYNDLGDHISTVDWYRVDKTTGTVSKIDTVGGQTE